MNKAVAFGARGILKQVLSASLLVPVLIWMTTPAVAQSGGLLISSAVNSGSNLVVTGSNGLAGVTYYVMASTNLAATPMALWQRISTNVFSANGKFTNNIPISPSVPQKFLVVVTTLPAKTPGLVAAYSFDEGAGTTVNDSSGNTNNGTISNTAWTAYGRYGGALMFDGASAFVTVKDSASLHLTNGMTLEAWVNPVTANDQWSDIVYKGHSNNDDYFLEGSSPNYPPAVGGTFGSASMATYGTSALPADQWSHVAATYNGAMLRLYVNGVQVSSLAQTGNIMISTDSLQIGGDSYYSYQFFWGEIDEVRVYNLPLTAAQIQADMNLPVGTTPSAPGNLAATTASSGQINLTWTAATAVLGVAAYLVEREGTGDINFVQIDWTKGTNYSDLSLPAGTNFSYRVRAVDTTGNIGPYSNVAQASTALAVKPKVVALTPTQPQQFGVNLTNFTVNWSVDGVVGGSVASGTITTASGLYSPPNSVGTHTVTATTSGSDTNGQCNRLHQRQSRHLHSSQ